MICKYCGKENKEKARFCENCGVLLPNETMQAPSQTAQAPSQTAYDPYAQSGSTYDPYAAAPTAPVTSSQPQATDEVPASPEAEIQVFAKLAQIFGYLSFFIGPVPAIVMAAIGLSRYKHPTNRAKCKKGLTWGIVGGVAMVILSYILGFAIGILMYL